MKNNLKLEMNGLPNKTITTDPIGGNTGHKNPHTGERVYGHLRNRTIYGFNIGNAIVWDAIGEQHGRPVAAHPVPARKAA
jgi:hypothetical protein